MGAYATIYSALVSLPLSYTFTDTCKVRKLPLLTSVALPLGFTAMRQNWCKANASKAGFDVIPDEAEDLSMLSDVLLNCSFMKVQLAGFDIDATWPEYGWTLLHRAAAGEEFYAGEDDAA